MNFLCKMRGGLVRALEVLVSAMVGVLVLDVLWGVFTRFVLGHQATYTDELACVLLVWISMFGAALAFGRKMHLGVDFFTGLMSPLPRKEIAATVQIFTIAVATIVFVAGGWKLAQSQMSQELPTMRWLSRGQVYLSLPLAGLFILLFSFENLAEILKTPAEKLGAQTKSEE